MENYIVIHGNVIYKVENVKYSSTDTHRVFTRNGVLILSVPLSSVLVMDGKGVTAQVVNGLKTGAGVNSPETKTTVIQSEDNFVGGMVVGGIIGAVLF
jgi:hypothetical protein